MFCDCYILPSLDCSKSLFAYKIFSTLDVLESVSQLSRPFPSEEQINNNTNKGNNMDIDMFSFRLRYLTMYLVV